MTRAISEISEKLNIDIKEFTVAGIPYKKLFAHKWYIGTDQPVEDIQYLRLLLDQTLSRLNDDYAVERKAALREVLVEVLPSRAFYDWMKLRGKEGGQHKFPRVLISQHNEWDEFVQQYK
jgi:hypothetical protein